MNLEEPVYSCNNCEFTACNRQELAQHLMVAHKRKVFKCHLCSFISCYKNSFDRHKKVVHKFIACEVCGVQCDSEQDLLQHTRDAHADLLSLQESPTKRRGRTEVPVEPDQQTFDLTEQANALYLSQFGNHYGKEVEDPVPLVNFETYNPEFQYNQNHQESPCDTNMDLLPQKFKRSYPCKDCDYRTFSPRDYLYHRRHDHDDNNAIHECKLCIYATKHLQKLDRHNQLVHKLKLPESEFSRRNKPKPASVTADSIIEQVASGPIINWEKPELKEEQTPAKSPKTKFPCTKCDFQSKSKFLLAQHEKTVHLRKKFFRCLKCGFVTNERGRYNKHVKYHNLPALICSKCSFNTPYKWNLDRHMKNHQLVKGKYNCNKCDFKTNSGQSFKTHTDQHHIKPGNSEEPIPQEEKHHNDENKEDDTEVSSNEEDEKNDIKWNIEEDESEDDTTSMSNGERRKQDLRLFRSISPIPDTVVSETETQRYPCPLCGVNFNSLSWLARHLSQKHAQSPNVKKLTKAVRKLSPKKTVAQTITKSEDNSQTSDTRSKYRAITKSSLRQPVLRNSVKSENSSQTIQPEADTPLKNKNSSSSSIKLSFPTHVCRVCMYKNTIMAEMERHILSHCTDKPFGCHMCKFRCRWKGDMKKHILKVHGSRAVLIFDEAPNPLLKYMYTEPTPPDNNVEENDENMVCEDEDDDESSSEPETVEEFKKPKTRTELGTRLKEEPKVTLTTKSRTITPPARSKNEGYWQNPRIKRTFQQDSPLDLSTVKDEVQTKGKLDSLLRMEPMKLPRAQMKSSAVFSNEKSELQAKVNVPVQGVKRQSETDCFDESQKEDHLYRYLEAQQNYFYGEVEEVPMASPHKKKMKLSDDSSTRTALTNKKYKCSYCPFMSRTASRFHVHIVQHLNKKPFMCSVCSYRSNWEWDITKHIKIKSLRDSVHASALMVITDETGRKNYEKYNKYLIEESSPKSRTPSTLTSPSTSPPQDDNLEQILSPEDLVETILVTPDFLADVERYTIPNQPEQPISGMVFRCGHCLFKHPEKKAVIGHLGIHSGSKPYKCKICGIVSSWRHVLLRHVKAMHGSNIEAVEDRLQYTIKGNIILIAGDSENSEQPISTTVFQCHLCPYTSDYNHHMQMHLRQHEPREGANIKCPQCPYWVKYRKTLSSHMRFHPSNEISIAANYSRSLQPPTLTPEVNDYTESMVGQCDDGSDEALSKIQEFEWQNSPPLHDHHEKKHRCEICPFRTDNKSHFMYHKQFHRPNKNAPFKCTHCSYWSGFKNILNKHMRTHDEGPIQKETPVSDLQSSIVDVEGRPKKMFKCRFCPMMNKRRANVVSHEAQHTKGKPMKFVCELCSYQSNSQGVMTSHLRLHGNENVSIAEVLSESLKYPPENAISAQTSTPKTPVKQPTSIPRCSNKRYFTYICKRCPAVFKSKSDYLTHCAFHGSSLPFQCPHCDYRARHKPHLHRHSVVHTPDYMQKREKSIRATVPQEKASSTLSLLLTTPESPSKCFPEEEDIDDVAALEREKENLQIYFRNKGTGKNNQKKHRCKMCPIAFNQMTDLLFHKALHRCQGYHKCPKCSYSTNNKELRNYHTKLHTKSIHGFGSPMIEESPDISLVSTAMVLNTTPKTGAKVWACALCPAVFLKQQRYDKHISLHGANNSITCTDCNYSVRYLANLNKHKKVHQPGYKPYGVKIKQEIVEETTMPSSILSPISPEFAVPASPLKKSTGKAQLKDAKEKHIYACSNCPYISTRRDNVGNHLQKHSRIGSQVFCPYCDYATSSASFLKDHIKWHFQPRTFMKVKAYMKYEQLEIWTSNGSRNLLFKDHGNGSKDRFFPEMEKEVEEMEAEENYEDEKNRIEVNPGVSANEKLYCSEMLNNKEMKVIEVTNLHLEKCQLPYINEENLIRDAMQPRKTLEIVLTDVFSNKKLPENLENKKVLSEIMEDVVMKAEIVDTNNIILSKSSSDLMGSDIVKRNGNSEEFTKAKEDNTFAERFHCQSHNEDKPVSSNMESLEPDMDNMSETSKNVVSSGTPDVFGLSENCLISKSKPEVVDIDISHNESTEEPLSSENVLRAFLNLTKKREIETVRSYSEVSFCAEDSISKQESEVEKNISDDKSPEILSSENVLTASLSSTKTKEIITDCSDSEVSFCAEDSISKQEPEVDKNLSDPTITENLSAEDDLRAFLYTAKSKNIVSVSSDGVISFGADASISKQEAEVDKNISVDKTPGNHSAEDDLRAFLNIAKTGNNETVSTDGEISFCAEEDMDIDETGIFDDEVLNLPDTESENLNSNLDLEKSDDNSSFNTEETNADQTISDCQALTSHEEPMEVCEEDASSELTNAISHIDEVVNESTKENIENTSENYVNCEQHELQEKSQTNKVLTETSKECTDITTRYEEEVKEVIVKKSDRVNQEPVENRSVGKS